MSQGSHSYDHEVKIDSTTKGLNLVRGDNGAAMYSVIEEIPKYQNPLKFLMSNWQGGHGQFAHIQDDVYFDGQSIDTTLEGKIILGPLINQVGISGDTLGANPVAFCWFGAISKLMVATATKVFWYDGTNFVEQEEFAGETITDLKVFNDILYVALGSATKYYYSSDGAAYTQTDLTDGYAVKFFVSPNAAGTSNVLWKSKLPNEISSTTDGRTVAGGGSQWSTAAYVGDTTNDITNIFRINDNLMIGKEDNLFHYDSDGGVHPYMDALKHNRHASNFKYMVDWQTATYFSVTTGLGEIVGSNTYEPMGPLTNIDDIAKNGTCVGLASDKDFLYAIMDEGTNSIIYKGREIRRGERLRWEWCPWAFFSTNACATAMVVQHTATDRRLWFGYGNYAGYVILTDNPMSDSAARFAASGFIRFSYTYGSNPYWDKLFQSIVTETKNCSANLTVQPKYRIDTETSMTNLTAAITTNGVISTDLTTALAGKRFQFELDLATNDSTTSPEVTYFEARGAEKPETVKIHEAVYAIGDMPSRKAETIRTFLRAGRTSSNLIRFADLRYGEKTSGTVGTDFAYCVMQPGYPQEIEVIHEKGRAPELGIKCRFVEVLLTTATADIETITLPTGVLNNMIYHNGTTWATLTPAQVMAILSGNAGAHFSMNSKRITAVADPSGDQDAATKKYVDDNTDANTVNLDWDTCWADAVHSHASDAEGGALTSTLLDDTAGGTNGATTKAASSNVMYDHGVATTGIHGASSNHLALFGAASTLVNRFVGITPTSVVDVSNITTNVAATDVDLTATTSANAKWALLGVRINFATVGTGTYVAVGIGKNGAAVSMNFGDFATSFTNASWQGSAMIVELDAGQIFEYRVDNITGSNWTIRVYIVCYGYIE